MFLDDDVTVRPDLLARLAALVAVLIATTDAGVVFAVAGAALLFAASLFARVTVEGRIAASTSHAEVLRHELMAGYSTVLGSLRARLVVGLMIAQKFVRGCLNVLIVVTAFRVLDAGPGAVGYMTAAIGIGGLISALGALTLVGRQLRDPFGVLRSSCGAWQIVLVARDRYLALALVLLGPVGVANSVEDVAAFTLRSATRLLLDALLTRVLGVVWGLAMGALTWFDHSPRPSLMRDVAARRHWSRGCDPVCVAHRMAWPNWRSTGPSQRLRGNSAAIDMRAHVRPSPDVAKEYLDRHSPRVSVAPVKSSFARARSETTSTCRPWAIWRWRDQA